MDTDLLAGASNSVSAITCLRCRLLSWAAVCLFGLAIYSSARASETAVDLALVLAVDVSSSMNEHEQEIQRAGYAEALADPVVIKAILSGQLGRIAVTYMEWAGPIEQSVAVPWRLIDSETSARGFVAELAVKRTIRGTGTSISAAIAFAASLFGKSEFVTNRRVIDVSGDGPNNLGLHLVPVRDLVVGRGIVINGLPLMLQPSPTGYAQRPDLADYFRECLIGGPGAFVLAAYSTDEIATAIRQKLVQEIASRSVQVVRAAMQVNALKADCMIGQKEFYE